ncbi:MULTISPECIES: hypothetical protein [Mycobacteroides]|uniref:Uncharacterized protein n=1 Tax=Mycobacteroides immunogenum TaxID=83262 RepID=A0A179VC75_9MYCO|nr:MULTISPECIES: hypothetical protein [Mycobacteroides]OAT69334.1 hypothetical protein AWB85_21455 [Mycobacteroides immunogenum]SKT85464.1 Uncharacterised protein [Mycobacteroides abscessus subsp. massiliense]SKU05264.1 Uncharacterised protein [Mycobacteroides abscessus subsp. massiliense]
MNTHYVAGTLLDFGTNLQQFGGLFGIKLLLGGGAIVAAILLLVVKDKTSTFKNVAIILIGVGVIANFGSLGEMFTGTVGFLSGNGGGGGYR